MHSGIVLSMASGRPMFAQIIDQVKRLVSSGDWPTGHEIPSLAVDAERAFLARLGGGCLAPAAAHARVDGERLILRGRVVALDGSRTIEDEESGALTSATRLGETLAVRLLDSGAGSILASART